MQYEPHDDTNTPDFDTIPWPVSSYRPDSREHHIHQCALLIASASTLGCITSVAGFVGLLDTYAREHGIIFSPAECYAIQNRATALEAL